MHFFSSNLWPLLGLSALSGVVNGAGVLEFDIVFPRNETYAPTKLFPIVFAVQNPGLAKNIPFLVDWFIRNHTGPEETTFGHTESSLSSANITSDPHFIYQYYDLEAEGPYQLFSSANWASCNASSGPVSLLRNSSNFVVNFSIAKDGQSVDLVAATAKDKTCSAEDGIAFNVTDETGQYPAQDRLPAGTCAVFATSSPTPTANPCAVQIDTATAASMSASLQATLCKGLNPPADCPKGNHAAERLAVLAVTSFAATFGAVAFFLA
ncbi:hypothetical protein V8F06_009824 [Rhypophila decipiens]